MTVYADFDAEGQRLLRASLEAAAIAVSAASLGRSEETVSEGFAAAAYLLERRGDYVDDPLLTSVVLELEREVRAGAHFPDYLKLAEEPGAEERALETLRSVAELLDARATPDEAAGYRRCLMAIATTVAEAGKEDQGFLGRGGVRVNDAERAALERIAGILGTTR